mmetsp:Transcript_15887/g.56475  ORF Transcript_15887/g.56475 Transcript_15887/m.56475 type:complete len:251 (+) Transcript_15887:1089-1841(+)
MTTADKIVRLSSRHMSRCPTSRKSVDSLPTAVLSRLQTRTSPSALTTHTPGSDASGARRTIGAAWAGRPDFSPTLKSRAAACRFSTGHTEMVPSSWPDMTSVSWAPSITVGTAHVDVTFRLASCNKEHVSASAPSSSKSTSYSLTEPPRWPTTAQRSASTYSSDVGKSRNVADREPQYNAAGTCDAKTGWRASCESRARAVMAQGCEGRATIRSVECAEECTTTAATVSLTTTTRRDLWPALKMKAASPT